MTPTPSRGLSGEFQPFAPTERVTMLRVYLSSARDILRGSELAGCSPFSREELAKEIDRQLETDIGRAAVSTPTAADGDGAGVSDTETPQGDSICQESDGCPTEKAVLQREWRRMKALLSRPAPVEAEGGGK